MICTTPTATTEAAPTWLGAPCPDCGHTTLAHPGPANPALTACMVCEIQATVQELRARVDKLETPSTWLDQDVTP